MNVRALIFGLNCAVAALLALFVAFSFELSNPTWAVTTVFIASQPVTQGGVWAKGFYRVVGTVLSLSVALLIIPNLIDAPEVMMLALATWLGVCLYFSLLDRSPRAYLFMLSGYTAILIGLPVITGDPSAIFDTAIARTEEILIGVGAATLVHGLFPPQTARGLFRAKLDQTLVDARAWILSALAASTSPDERRVRRQFAAGVTELISLGMTQRFELPEMRAKMGLIRALEDRLVALLPLLSAMEERREALQAYGPIDARILAFVHEVCDWVRATPPSDAAFEHLVQTSAERMPQVDGTASRKTLLELNYVHRLALLASTWRDCIELGDALREPFAPVPPRLAALAVDPAPRTLHRDRGIALRSGLVAALSVGIGAALGMLLQWPPAASTIGLSAVVCSLFATFDDPTPVQTRLLAWILLGIPLAALYVFAITPAVDGFPMLALSLFPLYTALGFFMARPTTALQGVAMMLAATTLTNLQSDYRGDFITFVTSAVAVVLGIVIALVLTQLLRVVGPDAATRRLLRLGWADVASMARRPRSQTVAQFAMRMLDRQALLVPRAARATPTHALRASDLLRDLQIGFNLSELAAAGSHLPSANRRSLDALSKHLGTWFEGLSYGARAVMPNASLDEIDMATRALLALPRSVPRDRGIVAAVGLRQNLLSFRRQLELVEDAA